MGKKFLVLFIILSGSIKGQTNCKFNYKFEPTDSTSSSCFVSILMQSCDFTYPAEAQEKHIEGQVLVSFNLSATCDVTDIKLVKGLGYGLDEIALNILQELAADIKKKKHCCGSPAGKPIIIPIRFKIY